ncbi:hypothetical protein [Vibrio owensii]|uniref:hypothetical protein n=1 Tax=Vibrio owensii TaxID=696485 RepID=UPI0012D44E29|nr:hypothetical protein [Vibrio owensii]
MDKSIASIDIDLPEIEDIPSTVALINKNDIIYKCKSQKALRMDYEKYIHGIIFRTICIFFDIIPVNRVRLSSYTQRLVPKTGYIENDYIITCKATRNQFERFNFQSLEHLDPIRALETCDLGRKMTKTGIFKSVSALEI